MKVKKVICGTVAMLTAVLMMSGCGSSGGIISSKEGASSEEKAIRNYFSAFLDGDMDGILSASAPGEFWDYAIDVSGLNKERYFYHTMENEEEFNEYVEELNCFFDENDISVKDIEIEEKEEFYDDGFYALNLALKNSGVEGDLEEMNLTLTTIDYCITYQVNDRWYCCLEDYFEDVVEDVAEN